MTTTMFLNGAAILGALEAFASRRPERASAWALRSATEVTAALLVVPSVTLSPIPESYNRPVGPYGAALSELSGLVAQRAPDAGIARTALRGARRWATGHPDVLRRDLMALHCDASYQRWLDWLIRNQWRDHIGRHGGLFEQVFVEPIARVLDVPSGELHAARRSTASEAAVRRMVARPDEELSELVKDAFTLSTLLRGRYYDNLSRKVGQSILHHPVRYRALPRLPASRTVDLTLPNTAWFMATIVIGCAFNARDSRRGAEWVRAVRRARDGVGSGELDVAPKDTDEVALRVAARNASRLGLRTHHSWVDQVASATVAVGLGVFASFYLTGSEAVAVGAAAQVAMEGTRVTARAAARVSGGERHLQRIGMMQAGRIGTRWYSPPHGQPAGV